MVINPHSPPVLRLIAPVWPDWSLISTWCALACTIAGIFLVWGFEAAAHRRAPVAKR